MACKPTYKGVRYNSIQEIRAKQFENLRETILQSLESSNESNDIRYQIISEKGASQVLEYKESLDEAKKMHTQGVPLSEIENKTKWYLFKDNWRRVSPEAIRDFKIKDNTINKVLTLKDVLGNENVLFNFYPQLRETKVVFADTNLQNVPVQTPKDFEESNGLFHEDSNTIIINTRNAKTQSQQEYTLSHEVVHNVQKLEGLPKGGGLTSVLSETLDILNLEGNKPLPQIYQEIFSADKSKLTINEKKIVQASIDTVSDLVLGRAGNLQSQYLHLMGEIDANIVEGAMNIRDNSGFIETSYSSLLNFYNESTNIDPDNILLLRNGNVRFNINESNKSAPKETVKEVINKLKETGLAEKVFELTSAEMEAKLVELGLDAEIAKQVSAWQGKNKYEIEDDLDNTSTISLSFEKGEVTIGEVFGLYDFLEDFESYFSDSDFFIEIQDLRINPEFQGQGLGKDLLKDTLRFIQERYGNVDIYLNASPISNKKLNAQDLAGFYSTFGFQELENEGSNVTMVRNGNKYPQFQKALNIAGIGMTTNGFTYKNEVYLNTDSMSEDTAIHEFNHLYTKWLKENNKVIYDKGISLIEEELSKEDSEIKDVIDFVKTNQPKLKGEALYEEILTEVVSRYSGQLMDEQKIKSPLMQWLSDFWKTIADLFNIFELSPSQVANLTLKEFSEYSVSALINNDIVLEKLIQLNIVERLC